MGGTSLRPEDARPFGLSRLVRAGDVEAVRAALRERAGEANRYDPSGYTPLLHALGVERGGPAMVRLLLEHKADVALPSTRAGEAGELPVKRALRQGDPAVVAALVEAGADLHYVRAEGYDALIDAVHGRDLARDAQLVRLLDGLVARDAWQRTAWLLAIQSGNVAKARMLREAGCDCGVTGRYGKPALFYAIGNGHAGMLDWLLALGFDAETTDDLGATALMAAGADLRRLSHESRRALLRLEPLPEPALLDVTVGEFGRGRNPRAGTRNPDRGEEPFWIAMIRAGVTGYTANAMFAGPPSLSAGPVWCADRFGQSLTFLDDGRIVQAGGEHEDFYDADFRIYNDVFVHAPDGAIEIYSYPEDVFPPTDFHSATLIDGDIYLIGSLGYVGRRSFGATPVRRLDTRTFAIETLPTTGEAPGWIHGHRAWRLSEGEIAIDRGLVHEIRAGAESRRVNDALFILDVRSRAWRRG